MTQDAVVEKILPDGRAQILVKKTAECGNCEGCRGCSGISKGIRAIANNSAGAAPGEHVIVESSATKVLGIAALVYILPIILMICGYYCPFATEGAKIAAAFLGLLCGMGVCMLVNYRVKKSNKTGLTICAVTKSPD